jgi:hypothetical protein
MIADKTTSYEEQIEILLSLRPRSSFMIDAGVRQREELDLLVTAQQKRKELDFFCARPDDIPAATSADRIDYAIRERVKPAVTPPAIIDEVAGLGKNAAHRGIPGTSHLPPHPGYFI